MAKIDPKKFFEDQLNIHGLYNKLAGSEIPHHERIDLAEDVYKQLSSDRVQQALASEGQRFHDRLVQKTATSLEDLAEGAQLPDEKHGKRHLNKHFETARDSFNDVALEYLRRTGMSESGIKGLKQKDKDHQTMQIAKTLDKVLGSDKRSIENFLRQTLYNRQAMMKDPDTGEEKPLDLNQFYIGIKKQLDDGHKELPGKASNMVITPTLLAYENQTDPSSQAEWLYGVGKKLKLPFIDGVHKTHTENFRKLGVDGLRALHAGYKNKSISDKAIESLGAHPDMFDREALYRTAKK